ncbi:MAG: type IV toxin-antitoxin system AbiEi family antitoxin domain-containing protein [bacterium]
MNQRTQNYLARFVERLQSQGRYSFTLAELRRAFELSDEALKKALYRLVRKQKIAPVRQGFYVVVPPEYLAAGILPPHLFIDDLMEFLGASYSLRNKPNC